MRRFTLVTLIALITLLAIAAYFQIRAARGPRRFPGPEVSISPSPATVNP